MWNEEKDDILRVSWGQMRTSAIAGAIGGVTRNAVIGRARRLGLAKQAPGFRRKLRASDPRPPKPAAPVALRYIAVLDPIPAPMPPTEPEIALVAGVLDLEAHHCRWPVGSGFCGCQKAAGSYCQTHNDRAWAKRSNGAQPAQVSFGIYRSRLIT